MAKYSRYKVNASELGTLMSREQGNNPPSEKDLKDFIHILNKDFIDLTARQKQTALDVISKGSGFDSESLTMTIKKSMYEQYAYGEFGINKVSATNNKPFQLEKGEIGEPAAIQLLSRLDNIEYKKNTQLFSSEHLKGVPDILIYEGEKIIGVKEIKVPLDFISFLDRVDNDCLPEDVWEVRAYLEILGLPKGELCYCLVDMPDAQKEKRLSEHKDRMILLGFTKEHIRKRMKQIERSMVYHYIPDAQKVRRFEVERKGYFTNQMRKRVLLVRKKMNALHNKFTNPLVLLEETKDL